MTGAVCNVQAQHRAESQNPVWLCNAAQSVRARTHARPDPTSPKHTNTHTPILPSPPLPIPAPPSPNKHASRHARTRVYTHTHEHAHTPRCVRWGGCGRTLTGRRQSTSSSDLPSLSTTTPKSVAKSTCVFYSRARQHRRANKTTRPRGRRRRARLVVLEVVRERLPRDDLQPPPRGAPNDTCLPSAAIPLRSIPSAARNPRGWAAAGF
jgi:hypothetical protein